MDNYKNIHLGSLIKQAIEHQEIEMFRICNFFKCSENEVIEMCRQESLPTDVLLRWSKLLEYDFFRLYSQHLILYSPPARNNQSESPKSKSNNLHRFRKNIYTKEIIDFILEQISTGKMTRAQIIEKYKIPKTTLYKWISKY
ncbi:transposase [Chryseobacterium lathyri]|jgi:hypothetical protein|uniref:Uncharacterized protein n=1 Tax=Chryseobacterium lathyri TaxID=395933 RepID=A0A511YG54_9FLAO|nr:transposase [Chryseobacterium lathyri]GEN74146.1 hypothetical protein CLA01_42180 [Chryseobacterium lathyri]